MSGVNEENLSSIQAHFHQLIWQRADHLLRDRAVALPRLEELHNSAANPMWFPVDGMYGGFEYSLSETDQKLTVRSWCRVVGGSGQEHQITSSGCVLTEQGFV